MEGFGPILEEAARRGHFDAVEDERLLGTFSRYLRVRAALTDIIHDLEPVMWDFAKVSRVDRITAFVVAYTAGCILIRSAGYIVAFYGGNRLVHEKLDQGDPRFGIPRKQFTEIYRSRTLPTNYLRFDVGRRFAKANLDEIRGLTSDSDAGSILPLFEREHSASVDFSKAGSLISGFRYRAHSMIRRRRSSIRQVSFTVFELGGRSVSNLRNPLHRKAITPEVKRAAAAILQPGDVIATRHVDAATNLFLPGFWPHVALHVGTEADREALGVQLEHGRRTRAADPSRVLEAQKDGVQFRTLDTTLQVDCFTIIRPTIAAQKVSEALSRASEHEGKGYDFEFDFGRSDRMVCTEVVYRGFHGIGGLNIALTQRAGRPTLSAEDLLDLAVEGKGFEVVALFGVGELGEILQGEAAHNGLVATYRK